MPLTILSGNFLSNLDYRQMVNMYRGSKLTVWEGGVRTPGFIRAPVLLPGGGREFPGLFHAVDFLPTLVSMADSTVGSSQTAVQIPGDVDCVHCLS